MGMILRIASSRIVGQGDIVGRSGYFSLNLSANSVMRGRLDARRTLKSLVADLRLNARPLVRHYKNRGMVDTNGDGKPDAIDYTHKVEFYTDYTDKTSYKDCFIVFPYPSNQIINSNGQLKQNIYE